MTRLLEQLPAEATFWARLETPFREYLRHLDAAPAQAQPQWQRTLTRTAWDAWALACQGVGEGAAGLRAASIAGGVLAATLASLQPIRQNEVNRDEPQPAP